MFESVDQLRTRLQEVVAALEPGALEPSLAMRLVEAFAAIENLAAAGRALAAGRVEDSGVWGAGGHRSAAQWMASVTGQSLGHAIGALETAHRLEKLPETAEAVRAGALSPAQAREIASAAAAAPGCERELLQAANGTLKQLQERCRQVRASHSDEASVYERIRRSRYFHTWTESDGAFRLDGRLTPDDGARLLAALEPQQDRVFRQARRAGVRERYDAYAADALVGLAIGVPVKSAGSVRVRVDHAALMRGRLEPGEVCEAVGVGPIPVAAARTFAMDGVVKAVVTDGVNVHAVAHVGRAVPARLRAALEERDPACCVPGCDVAVGLEIDHRRPFALGGRASLENLARLCRWHHAQKTYEGWRLEGEPGEWRWENPARLALAHAPP